MTNTSVLSVADTINFLVWLDRTGRHNLVAIDPVTKAVEALSCTLHENDTPRLVEFLHRHNGKRNLYFSINEPSNTARKDTKLRRDEIGAIRAFHVDIDNLEGEPDWDMDCLPSAIIDSGGGRWGFWKLNAEIAVSNSADVAEFEAQNRALTARFHGDGQAHNIDRIARLPGTLNIPNEAKRKKGRTEVASRVLSVNGLVYSPNEIASWCPPDGVGIADAIAKADQAPLAELDAPASVAKAARYLIQDAGEAIEGSGGNAATYQVAARLKDFGVSQQTAFELLLDGWNEDKASPPWPAAELLGIVKNAFAYGSAAPARNAANLAETEFESIGDSVPQKRRMAPVLFEAINQDLKAESRHLIQGWYDQSTMIVTYGESNSGKTHVVLDQSLAIAAGRPWAGCKTHSGLVVYVAAEGGHGLQRRVMAHRIFRPEHKNLPFALIPYPINLMHAATDAKELIKEVKQLESDTGQKCVMVVVDTLSRALAGGDENSSADMGAFVKRCDEIRAATGAALHVIHHAGKNTAKGARGHSLLRAAVDTEIEIENGAILSRKQRDMEAGPELRFAYKGIDIGENLDGEMQSSVVLDVWAQTEFEVGRTPQTQKVLDAAEAVIMQKIQNLGSEITPTVSPLELRALGVPATTLERAFGELVGEGVLVKCKRGLYKFNRTPKPPSDPQA